MALTRDEVLRAQHALSEDEIQAYVERCAPESRDAFEGWLRGKRHLDGEAITEGGKHGDDD